jgi:hypothetical protein
MPRTFCIRAISLPYVYCLILDIQILTNCLVLKLVDSFSRYAQLDKMTVFYVLSLVVHLCFIS